MTQMNAALAMFQNLEQYDEYQASATSAGSRKPWPPTTAVDDHNIPFFLYDVGLVGVILDPDHTLKFENAAKVEQSIPAPAFKFVYEWYDDPDFKAGKKERPMQFESEPMFLVNPTLSKGLPKFLSIRLEQSVKRLRQNVGVLIGNVAFPLATLAPSLDRISTAVTKATAAGSPIMVQLRGEITKREDKKEKGKFYTNNFDFILALLSGSI